MTPDYTALLGWMAAYSDTADCELSCYRLSTKQNNYGPALDEWEQFALGGKAAAADAWVNRAERSRAATSGRVWMLTWYTSSVGRYTWAAASAGAVLRAAHAEAIKLGYRNA